MTKEQKESFIKAALPLIQWLCENVHPYHSVIVTSTNAELLEGVCSTGDVFDFVRDKATKSVNCECESPGLDCHLGEGCRVTKRIERSNARSEARQVVEIVTPNAKISPPREAGTETQ